ncbi:terpene cyclase atmB [Hirsutella rhossiliensis]|uniref:Terpene cyclase atmB n=1 Tax=Hirsutella rhossiliensis TaxID=111463 RepID=A0A9P8SNK9_9HYPO|nr:terpene cyclase atmB [Hirsutella rhossiliensis]KAH0968509.1 terpene cyclase atmB [Hirsutella rhossiliensis]
MNVADLSRAPPEYHDVAWIADTCKLLMGVGWTTNYVGMIYKSLRDQTYGMALMPLCCNFAWELTYALIYPFGSDLEKEWAHAPLVQRNIPIIFIVCVAGWMSAHLALAAQIGPALAQAWSAYGCQLLLTVGGLSQLISRGHSRGASYFLWFSRFFGSLVIVPQDVVRYRYWRRDHEFMASPFYIWFVCTFLLLDGSYGICLWYVRRFEREEAAAKSSKKTT